MPTALSAYFASVPIVPALTVAAIAIGLVVRVSLLTSPKTYSDRGPFAHPQTTHSLDTTSSAAHP